MTYRELTEEVAALGFESEIENRSALIFCANRALRSIAALSPSFKRITFYQRVIRPISVIDEICYTPAEKDIAVPLKGAAFSLKFSGTGPLTLKERHRVTPFSLNSSYTQLRRYLPSGEGELILSGQTTFKLMDVACFEFANGLSEADIPMIQPFRAYTIPSMVEDFYGFSGLPTDENGALIAGAYFRDDTLYIPGDYEGEIHLTYRRVPGEILADAPNAKIDLSPALVHLLPLLTAAYLWLDDDASKAQFYMQMYMEGMRDVRMSRQSGAEAQITDTHNWA